MISEGFLPGYLPYLLHRGDQLLSQEFHRELLSMGVQLSEWKVLVVVHDRGASSVGDLAAITMLPQPTVTHAAARLEERKYVERVPGVDDRRQRIVSLTDSGMELAEELIASAQEIENRVHQKLGINDKGLRRELLKLIAKLEAAEENE